MCHMAWSDCQNTCGNMRVASNGDVAQWLVSTTPFDSLKPTFAQNRCAAASEELTVCFYDTIL
jgi:hypothetical protein